MEVLSQAEPPYEVLKTPWLSYDDIIRLKGLEEMVETYYNSGQFSNTVKVLCKQFDRPFLLFEALSYEYRARKMHEKKHSREAQYQFYFSTLLQRVQRLMIYLYVRF